MGKKIVFNIRDDPKNSGLGGLRAVFLILYIIFRY